MKFIFLTSLIFVSPFLNAQIVLSDPAKSVGAKEFKMECNGDNKLIVSHNTLFAFPAKFEFSNKTLCVEELLNGLKVQEKNNSVDVEVSISPVSRRTVSKEVVSIDRSSCGTFLNTLQRCIFTKYFDVRKLNQEVAIRGLFSKELKSNITSEIEVFMEDSPIRCETMTCW